MLNSNPKKRNNKCVFLCSLMAPYDIDSHAHFYSSEREAKAIQLEIRVVVEGKKKRFSHQSSVFFPFS